MEITHTRLAALVAGTAILAAVATAFFGPAAKYTPRPKASITKGTMGCESHELLDSLALIASKGTDDQLSLAVDNATAVGTCMGIRKGWRMEVVSSNPQYSRVVAPDGRQMVIYTNVLAAE